MQALMLAAGMGRRMGEQAELLAKCMIVINGQTLLERAVESLQRAGIKKLIMVTGWESRELTDYIKKHISGMDFEFIDNPDYAVTNNIYSLYLARDALTRDDTLLLESDLVYDKKLLQSVVQSPDRDLAVVAKFEEWMDGTVTLLSQGRTIREFIAKKDFLSQQADSYYKTVNIYKFSRGFSKNVLIPALESYIHVLGKNEYYEMVLKELTRRSQIQLGAFVLQDTLWYEIDNPQDLKKAIEIFRIEAGDVV